MQHDTQQKGKCEVSISGTLKQWLSEADLENRDRQMTIEPDPALDDAELSALVRLVGMLKWHEPELRFWYRHFGDCACKKSSQARTGQQVPCQMPVGFGDVVPKGGKSMAFTCFDLLSCVGIVAISMFTIIRWFHRRQDHWLKFLLMMNDKGNNDAQQSAAAFDKGVLLVLAKVG